MADEVSLLLRHGIPCRWGLRVFAPMTGILRSSTRGHSRYDGSLFPPALRSSLVGIEEEGEAPGMLPSSRTARPSPDSPIVVVGAGYFGSRALAQLRARHPGRRLAVVDHDASVLEPWCVQDVEIHLGDAVAVLDALLERATPRWVIPAVPFHLAHAWVVQRLSRTHRATRTSVPADLPVPNAMEGATGDLYCGYASFRCPEDCPEPRGRCYVTGEPRPVPLFRLLADLQVPERGVLGIRSHQLAPGVGGYRGAELLRLLEAVRASVGDPSSGHLPSGDSAAGDLILFTACRCQGVLSGLDVPAASRPVAPEPSMP
jgi:hypothetical protein